MASLSPNTSDMGHFSPAALLGTAAQTSDGDPAIKETLARIADACVPRLEKTFGEGVTPGCSLAALTSETAMEFLASLDKTAVTGVFEVPGAEARMVVSLDHDFVQLYIELMCGGDCGEVLASAPRAHTTIDRQFCRSAFNLLAGVFEHECAAFHLGAISFAQIESKLDPQVLGSRFGKVAVATLALECGDVRATLRVAMPAAVTGRIRHAALPASSAKGASDPVWTEHFQSEVGRAMVKLDAYLDANSLRLGDVANLKIGQTLLLPRMVSSRCELRSEKKLLFRCELGQTDGRYSVRISETSKEIESAGQQTSVMPDLAE
jgi:flagellar motor switch protein FliM